MIGEIVQVSQASQLAQVAPGLQAQAPFSPYYGLGGASDYEEDFVSCADRDALEGTGARVLGTHGESISPEIAEDAFRLRIRVALVADDDRVGAGDGGGEGERGHNALVPIALEYFLKTYVGRR